MAEADARAEQAAVDVAVLGTGTMGEAVLAAVLAGGQPAGRTLATARRPERAAELTGRHGVRVVGVREAAAADVVVLGVKPQQLEAVAAEVAGAVREGALLVSLLAGVTTARLASLFPGAKVVRTVVNTPALVGAGVTVLAAGAGAGEDELARTEQLLAATGTVLRLAEGQLDAATGVSGSGPAFVFAVADALAEGGVGAGLPRAVALQLAAATVLGAGRLMVETGTHPALLREQVTSPAGTTAAGLRELDAQGMRAALVSAVMASARRSGELAG
ncbi:pyrroline-5-carboxylate reductase [Quadrisphaera oryzae]|uniref:pyrroline-5-carboxylate reductase n=1 Tax=Quadrisphaera TaxID=317661 RepID=UPI00351C15B0